MVKVLIDLSISVDGFITGPNPDKENGLGTGKGGKLHEWYFNGDTPSRYSEIFKPLPASREVVDEMFTTTGAIIVGRKWYDITNGWQGNHPIRNAKIFVLTHKVPANPPHGESTITYVTDGLESALSQAKAAAGDKNVTVGGANVAQQYLKAGLVDEIQLHQIPILLGDGVRLFDDLCSQIELEILKVTEAPGVTHFRYRVVK
jgi:dihydrofolate reductase